MKRNITLAVLAGIITVSSALADKYNGGNGTESDPYQINTAEQLMLFGDSPEDWEPGKYTILTADIDLADYDGREGRRVFNVIARYTESGILFFGGVFDGAGHTISNLYINDLTETPMIGLFGYVKGGQIKNLGIINAWVHGYQDVGALAGYVRDGSIDNCYTTGMVEGGRFVGGLTGSGHGLSINSSYSTCTVTAESDSGGLVGQSISGTISDSYATGSVTVIDEIAGGLVGRNYRCDVTNSYATGDVECPSQSGGLLGQAYDSAILRSYATGNIKDGYVTGGLIGNFYGEGEVTDCYAKGNVDGGLFVGGLIGNNEATVSRCYAVGSVQGVEVVASLIAVNFYQEGIGNGEVFDSFGLADGGLLPVASGSGIVSNVAGKTLGELMTQSTYADFPSSWDFIDETDNGIEDTWAICDGAMTPVLAWQVEGDVCDGFFNPGGSGTKIDPYQISDIEELLQIGEDPELWDKHFVLTASIDIMPYNFDNDWPNFIRIGTFEVPFTGVFDGDGYSINGLFFSSEDIDDVGMFGCIGEGGVVRDLHLSDAGIDAAGGINVGILAGINEGTVENCTVSGAVFGNYATGGVIGLNMDYATVSGCESFGEVIGTFSLTGGIAGGNYGRIEQSCSNAFVTGQSRIGSIVGYNAWGVIENCYSYANPDGIAEVGGLVGCNYAGEVTNCFATGTPAADSYVGALIGKEINDLGIFTACYYDTDINGHLSGTGSSATDPAGIIGETTGNLMLASTYTGWDITTPIWAIRDNLDYPKLSGQLLPCDIAGSWEVNLSDFQVLAANWQKTGIAPENANANADFDESGTVGIEDIIILSQSWLSE